MSPPPVRRCSTDEVHITRYLCRSAQNAEEAGRTVQSDAVHREVRGTMGGSSSGTRRKSTSLLTRCTS
jgi:hypothetical protein